MGEVYRAHDTRLGRDIAVKVLPVAVASSQDRLARFEREARAVAALNHPNIVVLHSVENENGIHFLTMELVEGQSLATLVTPGGLPLSRVLELSIPLTDALAAAHERGVIHRDLKPGNVMVTREGRVKVLDFGLAKMAGSEEPDQGVTLAATAEPPISSEGQVLGTIPYMAPEQLRGETVDARADLFALGIILYELSTGRRPFVGRSSAEISSSILRDTPEPLTRIRADHPADLERIVSRCLEKNPRERIQSALDVNSELRRLRKILERGEPEKPAPEKVASIAVLPFVNRSASADDEYFSDGLSEELMNALAKNPGLRVIGRTSSFAFKGKSEDLRQIGQKLGVTILLEGSVRKAGNRVRVMAQLVNSSDGFHVWSDTYDRVLDDIFAVQDDIARAVAAAMNVALFGPPLSAAKRHAENYDLVLQANNLVTKLTEPALEAAIGLYREALARAPDDARAWAGLAKAYMTAASFGLGAPSDEGYLKSREAAERALALDDSMADAHQMIGEFMAHREHRWKDALEAFRRARALAPGDGDKLASLAAHESMLGHVEEAYRLSDEAVALDPLSARTHMTHGRTLWLAGRYDDAQTSYIRALELSPNIITAHAWQGVLHAVLGRTGEGVAEARKEVSPGYRNWGLAITCHMAGDSRASEQALAALVSEGEQWSFQIATAYAMRKEPDPAFEWLERAYRAHDHGVVMVRASQLLESLHGDPRWDTFLKKMGFEE